MNACERYNITANNLSERHEASGPSQFFKQFSEQRGIDLTALRNHLEISHADYFVSIFSEGNKATPFAIDYFNARLKVGKIHNEINLPLKWFISAYAMFESIAERKLRRRYPHRPVLRRRGLMALKKAFNYDIQAISDAFFIDLLDTLGIDTAQVLEAGGDKDIAEQLPQLKKTMPKRLKRLGQMSQSLLQGSQQLSQSSHTLEQQAQSQTASLQRTASAIGQITQSLKHSGENAKRASTIATEGGTNTSGNRDNSVLETMEQLSESSSDITNISGLIEEIAFQTNLLALNAAVEAARAGTHGRGFAIVANEVGELAKRSSKAANEIKHLIENSATRVAAGVNSVGEIAEMIRNIADSTSEQGLAIDDIVEAMDQADQSTQQNQEQVGKIVQLADQLSQQSDEVADIVSVFKLR